MEHYENMDGSAEMSKEEVPNTVPIEAILNEILMQGRPLRMEDFDDPEHAAAVAQEMAQDPAVDEHSRIQLASFHKRTMEDLNEKAEAEQDERDRNPNHLRR